MIDVIERTNLRLAFSACVRSLRSESGIAQERLALETEIDRGYMSSLERGLHTPTLETIYKLLPVLGVTFAEFAAEFEKSLIAVTRKKGNVVIDGQRRLISSSVKRSPRNS